MTEGPPSLCYLHRWEVDVEALRDARGPRNCCALNEMKKTRINVRSRGHVTTKSILDAWAGQLIENLLTHKMVEPMAV